MFVTVSWLMAPNGGERYFVGDSLHIDFFPVDVLVGLKLVVARDGEDFLLNIPGTNGAVLPIATPRVSFVIPPSIYDLAYDGEVSTVSDSCRILVHRYTDYAENIKSAGFFSIGDRSYPSPNQPPSASAAGDRAACPDSLFTLRASASDPDGRVALLEWSVGGGPFTVAAAGDTSRVAPSVFNINYPCVLRVTDDSGAVALDTHHVIVSWIRSPNGGEAFTVGDSLTVQLFAVPELVGLKLIVERAGEPMDLNVGGFTGSFSPVNDPTITFAIPDTIYDSFYGAVSTVSDSCRIRVFLYMDSQTYVQSAGCFSIHPRP